LNSNAAKAGGAYPFFTCSQETYWTDTFSFDAECVLLGGNNANGVYPLKYFKGKFDAYQRTYVVQSIDTDVLDNRYLYFDLSLKLELLRSISTGAATKFLTLTILNDIKLEVPPIALQQRIASILSGYDDLIDNNTRRIKILEQMAQMIYREWFVNFRFPGHKQANFVESPVGRIPITWTTATLADVVEQIIDYRGKTPKKLGGDWVKHGVPALSALNVKHGRLENLEKARFVSEDLYRKWMKSELKAGDILMTSEAPLGEVYFLPETRRYCLSQRVFSLRANRAQIISVVLYFFLSSPIGQKQITARASGTTVLGIRQADLRRIPIIQPDLAIQRKAEAILLPFLMQVDVLHQQNTILRQTRDLLLPKLISGEISVENCEQIVALEV
jgi:type I restriction enzyme S subunit